MPRKPKLVNAVLDFETDPFKFGRVPHPFAAEFHCDDVTEIFWGDDCVEQFVKWLECQTTPYRIYAHNGGKFDFHFLHGYLDNPIKVINSRIVHSTIGIHTLRDSLAIIPVPLKRFFKGSKGDIDYRCMERPYREKYKSEILDYLHQDCASLYKVVCAFIDRWGPKLTLGGAVMPELMDMHDFEIMRPEQDKLMRQFYFGGRVECFKSGNLKGPWKAYDINSSYPKSMRDRKHPSSSGFDISDEMPNSFDVPFFIEFEGTNKGALPIINDAGSLVFNQPNGYFKVCSHELEVALDYGLVTIDKIHKVYVPFQWTSFDTFVDKFYNEKVTSKINGDQMSEMFSKFALNVPYGKFGSNPENFQDWYINRDFGNDIELMANDYELEAEYDEFELWARPAKILDSAYFNVATAASITSSSRAILLDGLQRAKEPIYCDTDSIICREFNGEVSSTVLGAWKHEHTAEMAAIAGKKLYALYDPATLSLPRTIYNDMFKEHDPNPERKALKLSSKGGQITVDQIIDICDGKTVRYENDAPTFSLHNETKFIARNFRMTAQNGVDEAEQFI